MKNVRKIIVILLLLFGGVETVLPLNFTFMGKENVPVILDANLFRFPMGEGRHLCAIERSCEIRHSFCNKAIFLLKNFLESGNTLEDFLEMQELSWPCLRQFYGAMKLLRINAPENMAIIFSPLLSKLEEISFRTLKDLRAQRFEDRDEEIWAMVDDFAESKNALFSGDRPASRTPDLGGFGIVQDLRVADHTLDCACRPVAWHLDAVKSVAMTTPCNNIVFGNYDGSLRIWDLKSDGQFALSRILDESCGGHQGSVDSVSISADGCFIVSCSQDCTIKFWRKVEDGDYQCMQSFEFEGEIISVIDQSKLKSLIHINSVAMSANGSYVVAVFDDASIRVFKKINDRRFDCVQALVDADLSVNHSYPVGLACISGSGHYIVVMLADRTLKVCKLCSDNKFRCIQTIPEGEGVSAAKIVSMALAADGKSFVLGGIDGSLTVFKKNIEGFFVFTQQLNSMNDGHSNFITSISMSADGNSIISSSTDCTIKVWALREDGSFVCAETLNRVDDIRPSSLLLTSVSLDGNSIVSVMNDKEVRLWRKPNLESEETSHFLPKVSEVSLLSPILSPLRRSFANVPTSVALPSLNQSLPSSPVNTPILRKSCPSSLGVAVPTASALLRSPSPSPALAVPFRTAVSSSLRTSPPDRGDSRSLIPRRLPRIPRVTGSGAVLGVASASASPSAPPR